MKKGTIIILTIITLVLTFIFSETFSIYHFGSMPTLLTSLYLISIFAIFEYLSISIAYIVKKIRIKEKLEIKKIIGLILLLLALLFVLLFVIVLNIDYLNWYMYSSPFYLNVIVRSIEYLISSLILIIASIILLKKKK